jgi:hypothetical protein
LVAIAPGAEELTCVICIQLVRHPALAFVSVDCSASELAEISRHPR